MRKTILAVVIVIVLVFSVAPPVFAANGQPPRGSCPPGFDLHMVGAHETHDHHIGLKVNLNGDAYICVKHLKNGLHVHVDNVVR